MRQAACGSVNGARSMASSPSCYVTKRDAVTACYGQTVTLPRETRRNALASLVLDGMA